MSAKPRVALGLKVRTGRAAVVIVGGAGEAPQILVKSRVDVATSFEEGAIFHAAQEQPIEAARTLLRESEARFVARAQAGLAALLQPLGARLVAAAMAAPAEKSLPSIEQILKTHPLVHAAEGELYRRVFGQASAALGARPARVPAETLAARVSATTHLNPAQLAAHLAAMGKAAGRPWTAEQKEATLAAWLALASA